MTEKTGRDLQIWIMRKKTISLNKMQNSFHDDDNPITINPLKKLVLITQYMYICISSNIYQLKSSCLFFNTRHSFEERKNLNFIRTQQKNKMFFDIRICGLNICREVFVYTPIPAAKFSISDWEIYT